MTAMSANLHIEIPTRAVRSLTQDAGAITPPLLSASSTTSSASDDSFEALSPRTYGEVAHCRRLSQQFFFPRAKFESVVPHVVRAKDLFLKDHPIVEGAFSEYDELYHDDSIKTKDGKHMVRLLANTGPTPEEVAAAHSRRTTQQYFFPNQKKFESAVPHVIRARDVRLKDHPIHENAHAEYKRLYNADSVRTVDGRRMVRLL